MKNVFLVLVCAAGIAAAEQQQPAAKSGRGQAAPAKPAPAAAKPAAAATGGLPAGAQKTGEFTWRHLDEKGKTWIYRQTPFGYMKVEEKEQQQRAAAAAAESKEPVTVTEEGDSLRFERNSPFGKQTWTRKKSELKADEQKLWDEQQAAKQRPAQ